MRISSSNIGTEPTASGTTGFRDLFGGGIICKQRGQGEMPLARNAPGGGPMSSNLRSFIVLVAVMSAASRATPQSTPAAAKDQQVLPKPEQLFTDARIGRTFEDSKPGTI